MSTKHSKAAAEFLKNKKQAAWHDETLWLVRAKRDRLSKEVPEWEELRNMACATKLYIFKSQKKCDSFLPGET